MLLVYAWCWREYAYTLPLSTPTCAPRNRRVLFCVWARRLASRRCLVPTHTRCRCNVRTCVYARTGATEGLCYAITRVPPVSTYPYLAHVCTPEASASAISPVVVDQRSVCCNFVQPFLSNAPHCKHLGRTATHSSTFDNTIAVPRSTRLYSTSSKLTKPHAQKKIYTVKRTTRNGIIATQYITPLSLSPCGFLCLFSPIKRS